MRIANFFVGEDEIRSIRKILSERKINDRNCFTELDQIENIPFLNGHLCILHSNTSLLRFGDISLINMQTMELIAPAIKGDQQIH